jgi:ribosomal protein L21
MQNRIKLITLLIFTLFITGCSEKKESVSALESRLNELDTVLLNVELSGLEINRFRVFNHKSEMFRVGKSGFKLTIDDLNIHSSSNYKLDTGFLVYNKKTFVGTCYLKTSQIVAPVLDSSKQLKIGSPGYLNKSSDLIVFEFRGNFFPTDRDPTAAMFLTINDSTGLVKDHKTAIKTAYAKKANLVKSIESEIYLDGKKWAFFEKENANEIEKDSIVAKLKLTFHD